MAKKNKRKRHKQKVKRWIKRKQNTVRLKKAVKVICDTNIWYHIAEKLIEIKDLKESMALYATNVAISEMAISTKILSIPELQKAGIRTLFRLKKGEIHDPPMIYLSKMIDKNFDYDTLQEQGNILIAMQMFANGEEIRKDMENEFKTYVEKVKSGKQEIADSINKAAQKVKYNITNKSTHRRLDNTEDIKRLIIFLLNNNPYKQIEMKSGFIWTRIELFVAVLSVLLKDLETTERKLKANDINDIFQLIYVHPGDLFWTRDGALKRIIKDAGMKKYLFEE